MTTGGTSSYYPTSAICRSALLPEAHPLSNERDVETDQVSISLHRKARVTRMIGILRVLIVAAIAPAVCFLVAGMAAGGMTLLVMMGVAWVVSGIVVRKARS
ncbi:hypothetical protein [Streptomyces sp. NBC_00467]|uniref:hypothetical protein n=1 Tax=Streptomyces sp. NBC_00467 TaxID=2975752 RepID=UPI002E1819D8